MREKSETRQLSEAASYTTEGIRNRHSQGRFFRNLVFGSAVVFGASLGAADFDPPGMDNGETIAATATLIYVPYALGIEKFLVKRDLGRYLDGFSVESDAWWRTTRSKELFWEFVTESTAGTFATAAAYLSTEAAFGHRFSDSLVGRTPANLLRSSRCSGDANYA